MGFSVLRYLALSPDREYYLRELAKNVGCSVGGCHKVLKSLHEMGLVVRRVSGRNLYYSINDENPAVRHFKIFGNILELKEVVDGIKSSSKKILLFGSCANGSDTLDSDIDLLVLTENPDMLRKTLRKIQTGRPIKAIVLTAGEFIKLRERDKAFYREINKGIVLWNGRADDE